MISFVSKRWLTALWKTDCKRIGREQLMGYCSSSNKRQMGKAHVQHDDIGGSWTRHLPRTHQIYRYIWNNSLRKLELLSTSKDKGTTSRQVGDWETQSHKKTLPGQGQHTIGGISPDKYFFQRSEGLVPNIRQPMPWDLHQRNEPPKCLA